MIQTKKASCFLHHEKGLEVRKLTSEYLNKSQIALDSLRIGVNMEKKKYPTPLPHLAPGLYIYIREQSMLCQTPSCPSLGEMTKRFYFVEAIYDTSYYVEFQ